MKSLCLLCFSFSLLLAPFTEAQTPTGKSKKASKPATKAVKPVPTPGADGTPFPVPSATPPSLATPAPVLAPKGSESTVYPAPSPTPADPVSATKSGDLGGPQPTPGVREEIPVELGRRENEPVPGTAAGERAGFAVAYMGTLLSYPVPFKHGPAVAWRMNEDWMFEASYFTGKIGFADFVVDVGGFTETIIALDARYFAGKSFNWIFGLGFQNYEASLGSDLTSRFSGGYSNYDLVSTQTLGVQLGLGNRWVVTGFTVGVDWLLIHIPVATLKADAPPADFIPSSDDRGRVDSVLKFLRYIPTAQIAKLSLGWEF